MTDATRHELGQRAIRAYEQMREADQLGIPEVAQRHWEECIRCLLSEKGLPVPPSLQPGEPEPRP